MLARGFRVLTESLAPPRQHLGPQLPFFWCSSNSSRTALPPAAPFWEAPRAPPERLHLVLEEKFVLKIERGEYKNKCPKVIVICKFNL